jgi:hypothetical protein
MLRTVKPTHLAITLAAFLAPLHQASASDSSPVAPTSQPGEDQPSPSTQVSPTPSTPRPAASTDSEGRRKITCLVAGSVAMASVQGLAHYVHLPESYTRTAQLSTLLYTMGLTFKDKACKDYACRVPVAYAAMKAVQTDAAQAVLTHIPFGIGETLQSMGEEGKVLEGICAYSTVMLPAYQKVRDHTTLGKMIVHGE